jgi:hypothetical protein
MLRTFLKGGLTALVATTCLAAATAQAQTVSIAMNNMHRTEPMRLDDFEPWYISRADCDGDGSYTFNTNITSPLVGNLYVWAGVAGTDCSNPAERQNPTGTCWLIAEPMAPSTTNQLTIPFQNVIGAEMPGSTRARTCADAQTVSQNQPLSFWFMLLNDESGEVIGTPAVMTQGGTTNLDVGYNLIAPAPPADLEATPAPEAVELEWTAPTGVTDREGFSIYCAPVVPELPDDECESKYLVPGEVLDAVPCAEVQSAAAGSGTVKHLESGVRYAFAVGSFDAVQNTGKIGDVVCAVAGEPDPDASGENDGCSVAATPGRATSGGLAALSAIFLGAGLVWRRKKRASSGA